MVKYGSEDVGKMQNKIPWFFPNHEMVFLAWAFPDPWQTWKGSYLDITDEFLCFATSLFQIIAS